MDIRAIRLPLALVAVVLLVAVLSLLLIESRSVKDDYYLSHAERVRAIESAQSDLGEIASGVADAFARSVAVPATVDLAVTRAEGSNRIVQELADMPRTNLDLRAQLATFDASLSQFIADTRQFATQQNTLVAQLQSLQQESPLLVRYLREQGLSAQAQRGFSLAIDILEYAGNDGSTDSTALLSRVNELRNDTSVVPDTVTRLGSFADLAENVISAHADSEAGLLPVVDSTIEADLAALAESLAAANAVTVNRAERARFLLAACAVLLLLAAAYAVFRLQGSYRELNQTNARLEERVLDRTEKLSAAYEELKESQVQLIHAEKMSSLGEMVAGISHEINTPLWYLMNNSSVLQERLDVVSELCAVNESMLSAVRSRKSVNETVTHGLRELNRLMQDGIRDDIDEAKSLVQDSIDGLDDLTKLAQGLKDFSRLDRATQGEFDVNEGLERTLLIAKNKIKLKATVHKHYGDIPTILCSPSQVNQIFLNLLTNAADAIADTGDIVIHTSEQDGAVEVSISDTGCGIPAEVMTKIRNPFFTTKDVGKGTGLGLSIVDRIVTQHGGELRIESEPGKGTTVTVVLPIGTARPEIIDNRDSDAERHATPVDTAVLAQRPGHVSDRPGASPA
jgi:signal transduction histidine kinase